jgi:hypothetical protein
MEGSRGKYRCHRFHKHLNVTTYEKGREAMKTNRVVHSLLVAMAMLTWLLPSSILAGEAIPAGCRLSRDVALNEDGVLFGKLIDIHGQPVVGGTLAIRHRQVVIDRATSDQNGTFKLDVHKTGAFVLTVNGTAISCRCWEAAIAPPSARGDLILLTPEKTVRGQRPFADIITNPLFIGVVIAAAVAIPIAVSNSGNGS